jgi:hypothetical protein
VRVGGLPVPSCHAEPEARNLGACIAEIPRSAQDDTRFAQCGICSNFVTANPPICVPIAVPTSVDVR